MKISWTSQRTLDPLAREKWIKLAKHFAPLVLSVHLCLRAIFQTLATFEMYILVSTLLYFSVKSNAKNIPVTRICNTRWLRESRLELALCKAKLLPPRCAPLPEEIWSIILDFAIEAPYVFDGTCTAAEYHLFTRANRFIPKETPFWEDGRRIELSTVCRQWYALLKRRQWRWKRDWGSGNWIFIDEQRFPVDHPSAQGTRRIDVHIKAISNNSGGIKLVFPPGSAWEVLGGPAYDLTTLAMRVTPGLPAPAAQRDLHIPLELAMAHAKSLRSFICEASDVGSVSPVWMTHISQNFSGLTSLRLAVFEVKGSFTHPSIECLDLDAASIDLTDWWLPRLRHFTVGYKASGPHQINFDISPPCRAEDLLSLQLLRPYRLNTTVEFWIKYSSLLRLGGSSVVTMMLPPIMHPLAHVCHGPAPVSEVSGAVIAEEVRRIPNLKTYSTHFKLKEAHPAHSWVEGYRQCLSRGIEWTSHDETKVSYKRPGQWWFIPACVATVSFLFMFIAMKPNPFVFMTFYFYLLLFLATWSYVIWYCFMF